jgi:O-antigen chain-terminating methyltransferase
LVRQNAIGTQEYPILDLGCGRGEWLELLKEEGRTALGVDRNRVMVDLCRERNLEAAEGDALDYLRKAKANSLGAVTGFQFVEHIPPHTLVAILDECLRVLRSRGLIIFETPNPENLFVGAYSFYIDPTHRNPLVPDSLNFLAQQRGFVGTKILRLHKYGDFNSVDEKADEFQKRWFYSETDFALIGYKP